MKTAAIICEYNPFHNGHKFHIEETKKQTGADAVVVIMSGNFVQRGEVAIFDKDLRAKAAIECGADLCLELPAVYSCASAEFFARGAVSTLSALGIIDFLSFGAEATSADQLLEIAHLLADEPCEFSKKLKDYTAKGVSYPVARAKAVEAVLGQSAAEILASPNNILGVEYCKALILENSAIMPFPIKRTGADHDSKESSDNIASATLVRELILSGNSFSKFIPKTAYDIFKDAKIHSLKQLEKAILCELVKMPAEDLQKIADVGEGLENRVKAAALTSSSLDELIDSIKTKRYTHSRIRRIILSAFLGITAADRSTAPQYIKILDHNEKGQGLISAAKKAATLPLVRNTSQVNKLQNQSVKDMWERERVFDRLYEMAEI